MKLCNKASSILEYSKTPAFLTMPLHQKTASGWLAAKRKDDDTEGLWRVQDKLYDLLPFIQKHPGGSDWIILTKGTDITELVEISHLSDVPSQTLKDYYVKDAHSPRTSPYTFKEDGFYKTLKRRAIPVLKSVGTGPSRKMLLVQDGLLLVFVVLVLVAVMLRSYFLAFAAGFVLSWTMTSSHNFFHQRDNWRMYIFNLSFLSYRDWRVSHVLSHHVYTNTVLDWEATAADPVYQVLPKPKPILYRCAVVLYFHLQNCIGLPLEFSKRVIAGEALHCYDLLWLLELVLMIALAGRQGMELWAVLHVSCSYWFLLFGLTGAHHHPESFHDGDAARSSRDWGLCQLDAVADRRQVDGNLLLVAALFGQHVLHHMFPTVDHSKLPHLRPIFLEACREFAVQEHTRTLPQMFVGLFQQLTRTRCNHVPHDLRSYSK